MKLLNLGTVQETPRIPQETRVALYEKYTGAEEAGRCLCFNPGCRNRWLCLNPGEVQIGAAGD